MWGILGAIGVLLAARAGADVTVVHRDARPLAGFDADLVALLVRRTRELGIRIELDTEVVGVDADAVRGLRHGIERRFEADMAVHAVGRVPELADLQLDKAGVKREKRGVIVNQYLQSVSNLAVHAGHDAAASGPALTRGPITMSACSSPTSSKAIASR